MFAKLIAKIGKTLKEFKIPYIIIGGQEDVRAIILKNQNYQKKYIAKWLKEFDKSLNGNYYKAFQSLLKDIK